MVTEVNANMKLYFGVNTFKWVSPQKELDHGIPHLSEYFPHNSGIQPVIYESKSYILLARLTNRKRFLQQIANLLRCKPSRLLKLL